MPVVCMCAHVGFIFLFWMHAIIHHCIIPYSHSDMKEGFALFDKKGDNKIAAKDLGTVLRSLGKHSCISAVILEYRPCLMVINKST